MHAHMYCISTCFEFHSLRSKLEPLSVALVVDAGHAMLGSRRPLCGWVMRRCALHVQPPVRACRHNPTGEFWGGFLVYVGVGSRQFIVDEISGGLLVIGNDQTVVSFPAAESAILEGDNGHSESPRSDES